MGSGLFPPGVSLAAIIVGAELFAGFAGISVGGELFTGFAGISVGGKLFTRGAEWLESSGGTVGRMLAAAGWQVSGNNPPSGKALTT